MWGALLPHTAEPYRKVHTTCVNFSWWSRSDNCLTWLRLLAEPLAVLGSVLGEASTLEKNRKKQLESKKQTSESRQNIAMHFITEIVASFALIIYMTLVIGGCTFLLIRFRMR